MVAVTLPGLGQSGPAATTRRMGISARVAVDVYLSDRDDFARLLGSGKLVASGIFKKIGVCLNWHTGELPAGQSGFVIRTVENAPESAASVALASTELAGSSVVEITVYEDRVRRFLDAHPSLTGVATAYVLAHELAHAMQGVARHSESGILKAQWSNYDCEEMVFHTLAFTPSDVELIHRGLALQLAKRRSGQAAEVESGT
jgi:hypothetical protein